MRRRGAPAAEAAPMAGEGTYSKMADMEDGKSSMLSTVANAVKAVVGAGILSLSWAFHYSTMGPGLAFTAAMGLLAAVNFFYLGLCSELTGQDSYSKIWACTFGKHWAWLPELATFLFCLISNVAYLIIIGDYLPRGLEGLGLSSPWLQHRQYSIVLVSALLLPLNFLRDLSFLGYTSIIGTAGALYTTGVLLATSADRGVHASDWQWFDMRFGLFVMIPSVTFAFNGHFNAPALYCQLAQRSPARWKMVTTLAFSVCFCITVICGASGYLMFGSALARPGRSNVLTAPELQGKPEIMAAYLATALAVAFSIPLYGQSVVSSFEALCRLAPGKYQNLLALAHVLAIVGLSMVFSDLGLVNAINGAICACLLMFVFPSLMYLNVDKTRGRFVPILSISTGLFVGVLGVATSVLLAIGVDLA